MASIRAKAVICYLLFLCQFAFLFLVEHRPGIPQRRLTVRACTHALTSMVTALRHHVVVGIEMIIVT